MFGSQMFEGINGDKKDYIITKVQNNLDAVLCKDSNCIDNYKGIRVIGIKE